MAHFQVTINSSKLDAMPLKKMTTAEPAKKGQKRKSPQLPQGITKAVKLEMMEEAANEQREKQREKRTRGLSCWDELVRIDNDFANPELLGIANGDAETMEIQEPIEKPVVEEPVVMRKGRAYTIDSNDHRLVLLQKIQVLIM